MSEEKRKMDSWTVETITKLFQIFEDFDDAKCLWVGVENSSPVFSFLCNDEFFWGCSDGEHISPNDLPMLRQAYEDARAAKESAKFYGPTLFICRKRGMRPQGACYPDLVPELWPLLDACGPEREVGLGNPYRPGELKKMQTTDK